MLNRHSTSSVVDARGCSGISQSRLLHSRLSILVVRAITTCLVKPSTPKTGLHKRDDVSTVMIVITRFRGRGEVKRFSLTKVESYPFLSTTIYSTSKLAIECCLTSGLINRAAWILYIHVNASSKKTSIACRIIILESL